MIRRLCLIVLVALCLSCNSAYKGLAWAATALSFTKDAADKADLTVAEWLRHHGKKCYEQFKSKAAPEYAACINPRIAVQKKWAIARDAINSAWLVARGSLQAYWAYLRDKTKGKKIDVMKIAKPVVCAMASAAIQLRPHVPKIGEAEKILALVKAVTCGGTAWKHSWPGFNWAFNTSARSSAERWTQSLRWTISWPRVSSSGATAIRLRAMLRR